MKYPFLFAAVASSVAAAILPSDRIIDWSTAGVQASLAATAGHRTSGVGASVSTHLGSNIPNRVFSTTAGHGINVAQAPYFASGSETTTTGTIVAGTTTLTVASAATFVVGQGVVIPGALRTTQSKFVVTGGATSTGTILIAVHGGDVTVNLTAGDSIAQVAQKIRAATWKFNGGTITASGSGDTVVVSYDQPGGYGSFYTTSNNTGATGNWTVLVTGVSVYAPTITAINGSVLTVDTAPTVGVAGVVISHADGVAIQNAINNAPPGEVVFIPAGTYAIGSLNMRSDITIRGAGPNATILKITTGLFEHTEGISFGAETAWTNPAARSSGITGAVKGATSFTLQDPKFGNAGAVAVGDHLIISELNDPTFVSPVGFNGGLQTITWADGWDTQNKRMRGQIVQVTAVTGATVQFEPALYSAYTLTPWATREVPAVVNSGIEDLTIYATGFNSPARNVVMRNVRNCWLYNVKSDFATRNHVLVEWGLHVEIRKSHFREGFAHGSGDDLEVGFGLKTSHSMIVDNIVERMHVGILLSRGAAGNVVAYNLANGDYDDHEADAGGGTSAMGWGILMNHGAHPQYNLAEGNVTSHLAADRMWGSSSHSLWFRNWMQGRAYSHGPYSTRTNNDKATHPSHWSATTPGPLYEQMQAAWTVNIYDSQTRYSLVGNVIGDGTTAAAGFVRRAIPGDNRSYFSAVRHLMSIGFFDNLNNSTTQQEFPTLATFIDHGNYAFSANDAGQTFEPTIADRVIPASMFLKAKPLWMGSLSFPAIEPTSGAVPTVDQIPAGYRWLHANEDYLGAGRPTAPRNVLIRATISQ